METPPVDPGLSLTLAWSSAGARRRRSLPLGAFLRVGLGLALCAACYEAGRWHGGLEALAARTAPRPLASARTRGALPHVEGSASLSGAAAPGQPVGEPQDVITPLNVRDPAALVMGPGGMDPAPRILPTMPPPAVPEAEEPDSGEAPPSPPARLFPRPSAALKPVTRF